MGEHTTEKDAIHEAWVDLVRVSASYPLEVIPACGMPSPTNAMLCDLPATNVGHFLGQHLGIDRRGNFRGWPDKRGVLPPGEATP